MKRWYVLTALCTGLLLNVSLYGQNRVSVRPCPKAVLLEEQTGLGCGNCPDGAAMIATLKARMGAGLQVIAYHAGHYAEPGNGKPDFRTWQGDSLLASLWGEYGYPQGEIERVYFPFSPGLMAVGRGHWASAVESRLSDTATVNLYVAATLDASTRELKVEVEGYNVRASDSVANFLHVALVQNHIAGPQNGAPAGYLHEHVFRDFLTPLWGDTLTAVQTGDRFSKTYAYTVPADYRGVAAETRHLELVVFVSAGRDDVLNATGCKPVLLNVNDPAAAVLTLDPLPKRYGACAFEAALENGYNDTIKRIGYEVTLNGEKTSYEMDVAVPPYEKEAVTLLINAYDPAAQNTITFRITALNGTAYNGASVQATFNEPLPVVSPLMVELSTDARPEECYWYVADQAGEILYEFGPYDSKEPISVTEGLKFVPGIYSLYFRDTKWNGWQERPRGSYKIKDFEGKMVAQNYDLRDKGDIVSVRVTKQATGHDTTSVEDLQAQSGLYVAAAQGQIHVMNPQVVRIDNIRIYSTAGACLESHAVRGNGSVTLPVAVRNRVAVVEVESAGRFFRFKLLL